VPWPKSTEDGDKPNAVFLTCADARITPDVITASGSGDLYTVRNVGNLVPTDPADRSVDAALEFAVNELHVSSVVVCGHSSCGAMTQLLQDTRDAGDRPATAMTRWLDYARDSLVAYRDRHPARVSARAGGFGEVDQLSVVNVAVQVERLARHPILAPTMASGALQVVGMFFDMSTSHVYEVNQHGIVRPTEPAGAL
jgi:carbonic anhydrase